MRSASRFLLLALVLPVLASCDAVFAKAGVHREFRGMQLEQPIEKPDLVMTTADGKPFDLRRDTDGDLVFVYFGYINCPDVCPVHMANISNVVRKMKAEDAMRVHVIFVTTDPARDTDAKLVEWLRSIDPRIIPLRPTVDETIRLQTALNIQPAILLSPKPGHEGNYAVTHSSQVVAFTPDNRGRFAYAFGTLQHDWAHDIPLLLSTRWTAQ